MAAQQNQLVWQEKAACRGPLADVFFPPPVVERKNEKLAREDRAKQICRECPVVADCREYAISIREPHGVWGGLSEQERRQLMTR